MTATDQDRRREKWLRLLGPMLKAATDPKTPPGEAESMMTHAMRIMSEFGIDENLARANATGTVNDDPIVRDQYTFQVAYARAFASRLAHVAETLGCHTVMDSMRNGDWQLHLFGRRSVIERLKFLYPSLTVQCAHEMMAAVAAYGRPSSDKAFKRAFIMGYCQRIVDRMKDIARTQTQNLDADDASKYSLVLVSDRQQAQKLRDEAFPTLVQMRTNSSNRSGYLHGQAAGDRADLGQSRVGPHRRAIGN